MKKACFVFTLRALRLALGPVGSALLATVLLASVSLADAQTQKAIRRVGYLTAGGDSTGPQFKTFREGLRKLGYIEGKDIVLEFRTAEAKLDWIPALVAELVRLKLDVLVITAQPAVRAAKQATNTLPIVIVATFDPVATGIVHSLSRPGGNITGVTRLDRDLSGKRLELLKEVVPGLSRLAVLWNPDSPGPHQAVKEYEVTARPLKISIESLQVRSPNPDFDAAFQAAVKARASAVITARNSVLDRYRSLIAELAIKFQMPSMCERSYYAEAGCLMSYLADENESYRRATVYVDKILKGSRPADLPVEQPKKFELIINLKTAKQIGITIPDSMLYRADKVIR